MNYFLTKGSNKEPERLSQFAALQPHIPIRRESSSLSIREKTVDSIKLVPTVEYMIDEERIQTEAAAMAANNNNNKLFLTGDAAYDFEVKPEPLNINNTLYKQTTITIHVPANEEQVKPKSKHEETKPQIESPQMDPRQPSFVNREKSKITMFPFTTESYK